MPTVAFTTPGATTWTVPAGVTELTVWAWGSGGMGEDSFDELGGGGAAFASSVIAVTPGQTVWLKVAGETTFKGGSWINKAANAQPSTAGDGAFAVDGGDAVSYTAPGVGGAAASCVGSNRYSGGTGVLGNGGGAAGSAGSASGSTGGSPDGPNGQYYAASIAPGAGGSGAYGGGYPGARGEVRITYAAGAPARRPIRLVRLR